MQAAFDMVRPFDFLLREPTADSQPQEDRQRSRSIRLRQTCQLTPWRNFEEWDVVRCGLLQCPAESVLSRSIVHLLETDTQLVVHPSIDKDDCFQTNHGLSVPQALERVAVWRSRCQSLPHAIESTATLAHFLWRDELYTSTTAKTKIFTTFPVRPQDEAFHQNSFNDEYDSTCSEGIRYALACSVVRVINGVADTLQQSRRTAASVAVLCERLGIPAWLVDIRHQATHNALPSLSVLRMAARSLLPYFASVYWDAVRSIRQDQIQHVRFLLNRFHDAFLSRHTEKYEQHQQLASSIDTTINRRQNQIIATAPSPKRLGPTTNQSRLDQTDQISSDDAEEESDSEDRFEATEDSTSNVTQSGDKTESILGTSTNRFAALLEWEELYKKKRKLQREPEAKNSQILAEASKHNTSNKKIRKPRTKPRQSIASVAKKLVPVSPDRDRAMDIVVECALSYLVWNQDLDRSPKGGDNDGNTRERVVVGALVPDCLQIFPTGKQGFMKVQQGYNVLLLTLGQAYPGFLSTLLVHTVKRLLREEASPNANPRVLFFLDAWIRHFLSNAFVVEVFPTAKHLFDSAVAVETSLEPAPLEVLQELQFPLNHLCDLCQEQLRARCDKASTRIYCKNLGILFENILGACRVVNFGLRICQTTTCLKDPISKHANPMLDASSHFSKAGRDELKPSILSLDEMEAMLAGSALPAVRICDEVKRGDIAVIAAASEALTVANLARELVGTLEPPMDGIERERKGILERPMDGTNIIQLAQPSDSSVPSMPSTVAPGLSSKPARPAWVRCVAWEPCSIGSLPGKPY